MMNLFPVTVLLFMTFIEVIDAHQNGVYYNMYQEKKATTLSTMIPKYTAANKLLCFSQCQKNSYPVANYLSQTKECECLDIFGTLNPAPGWKTSMKNKVSTIFNLFMKKYQ